ncbi:MAG TPA: hypothetical protein VIY29_19735, partial [Ktedonobacteraceae bacterium]
EDALPRKRMWRLVAYGAWGLAAGLGLWSHLLVIPFVLLSGLLFLVFCRRDLRSLAPLSLLIGFVIGAMPFIYYNITAPNTQNSYEVALKIHSGVGMEQHVTFATQLSGTLFFSLPEATGLNSICTLQELPLFGPASSRTALCAVVQGGWSVGFIALMVIAALMALVPLWKLWLQHRSTHHQWTIEERQNAVLHMARLVLLCAAGLTLALFVLSPLAAEKPWSTRYLIGLLIATPAVMWPLWNGLRGRRLASTSQWFHTTGAALRCGIFLLTGVVLLVGTVSDFQEIPNEQQQLQQDSVLVHDLLQRHITHISAGYWVCDRLTFASQEGIVCNVVLTNLHEGVNRYTPYIAIVKADPTAPYVFPLGSDFAQAAAQNALLNSSHYRRFVLDGSIVYQPTGS